MSKTMHTIDVSERMKIAQLQNEKKNDKNRVEWLYNGDKVDHEAYLLGKPIDKIITEKDKANEGNKEFTFTTSTIDLASKIREDPLFEIKRQEIEAKKRLLENPLKFKQLQDMISKQRRDDDDHRRRRSDSYEDSKHRKHRRNRSRSRSRSKSRSRTRSPPSAIYYSKKHDSSNYGYKRSTDSDRRHDERNQEKIDEINQYKKRIDEYKKIRSKGVDDRDGDDRNTKKKMTDEERKLKLQQMSQNAQWRQETRSVNVKKYKHEENLDDIESSKDISGHARDAMNSLMRDAYSSAGDRIKRNYRNIQRSEDAYHSSFTRK